MIMRLCTLWIAQQYQWWMMDGDLIWESCISDDQQDFNHTRCEYGVNIVGSMCDTIDHKALLVTTEPCCSFGVWRGIQCV